MDEFGKALEAGCFNAEAEIPSERASNALRIVFARPESF